MTEAQREAVHCLWDKIADFPVSETDSALVYFMNGVSQFIDAGNAFWIGTLLMDPSIPNDPLRGWRPRANRYLHPAPEHEEAYRAQVAKMYRGESNEGNKRAVKDAGSFRSYRIRQVMPTAWFEGQYYKAYHGSRGFHDQCYVTFPLHEDCESYFAFCRVDEAKDFTAEEEEIAAYAVRGVKWFHRQLILNHGVLLADGPLTPMQRRILHFLLAGNSEKEIATEVGQSPHTTHKHISDIFRKFGVNSRASLMAMWLGQKP